MRKLGFITLTGLLIVSTQSALAQTTTTTDPTLTPSITTTTTNSGVTARLTQAAERKSAILTQAAARKETAASKAAERKEQRQENTMEHLRNRATKEIDRRIASLNQLMSRINAIKKLSNDQKTALTTQVQAEITNLTNLKTKILADTDIDTLRADVKSIVSSYRIYALFMPKIHIITAAEGALAAGERMTMAYNELKTRVDTAKAAGVVTTEMEAGLAIMQAKITSSTTQANSAISTVTPLTPDGYPGNKTSLNAAREALKTARQDLNEARRQGHTVMMLLRKTNPATTVPLTQTPTPPTTTP